MATDSFNPVSADVSTAVSNCPVSIPLSTVRALSPYVSPTPGYIPVIAFGNPTDSSTGLRESTVRLVSNSLINITAPQIYTATPSISFVEIVKTCLNLNTNNGLRMIIRGKNFSGSFTQEDVIEAAELLYSVSTYFFGNATAGAWMLNKDLSPDDVISLSNIKFGIVSNDLQHIGINDIWNRCVYAQMTTSKSFTDSTSTATPFVWKGEYAHSFKT